MENKIEYFENRKGWRNWLSKNFDTMDEIWFVFPNKSSGKKSITYNELLKRLFVSVGLAAP